MKMAMNELVSLCRAALEGSGWAQGDYEDAADAAVWLQASGLRGVDALSGLLGATPGEPYAVQGHGSGDAAFGRAPGLVGCLLAFELAWAQASRDGVGIVRVNDALAPRLALYGLKMMSARERRIDLRWDDADGRHFATTSGRDAYPSYLGCDVHANPARAGIVVYCHAGDEAPMRFDVAPGLRGAADPAELEARYDEALWRGLDIDDAQRAHLGTWKSRVLVEATAASREHGAGGQDDGF